MAAALRSPGVDPNLWWIDLRALPAPARVGLESTLGLMLLAFAVRPLMHSIRRGMTVGILALFALQAAANALVYWSLRARGSIQNPHGIPVSLIATLALSFIAWAAWGRRPHRKTWAWPAVSCALCLLSFPVLQVFCFGKTDYRRPAQIAVVPGARVYADGRLSEAVGDRVKTAAQLYREGWVNRLILSGGPGDGIIHETEAMRRSAISLGVRAEDISLDPLGLNTAATVQNTRSALAAQRVLVVSEFYHLPRLKMAFADAGLEVFTVPAKPSHWLRAWPLRSIAREVPAFWSYWLRGLMTSLRGTGRISSNPV